MATVVLLGFSCAGKSSLATEVCNRWPDVSKLDSDAWIAKPYGEPPHIYEMFFQLGRDQALHEIAHRERLFLDELNESDHPRLIAAGPALPSRQPQWGHFVDRVRPRSVYLVQTPEEVLAGLRERRACHLRNAQIAAHPLFGSWDQEVTTQAVAGNGWEEVDDVTALTNIAREMGSLVSHYQNLTPPEYRHLKSEVRQGQGREQVLNDIGHLLGVC